MATTTPAPRAIPIPKQTTLAGAVAPVLGRKAVRDVAGIFGFPLVSKGDVITEALYARANQMGRLYELIASTKED